MPIVIADPVHIKNVLTKPIDGQKPGTSGLRKKVQVFMKPNYFQNFLQSYFNALRRDALSPNNTLLVGGDGRYLSHEAIEYVAQIACANGVNQLHVAKGGIMSTPACSLYIRQQNETLGNSLGAIILTASHNPGGPKQDFGIKFNSRNGGPAQEEFTDLVFAQSKKIQSYSIADFTFFSKVDINQIGDYQFTNVHRHFKPTFTIKVVENVAHYTNYMKTLFDFPIIQKLLNRSDFKMIFDGMYGSAGPYAKSIFENELGNKATLKGCDCKPDFNGLHPDPNLVCAKELVDLMGVDTGKSEFDFGAACDGDADRNMILGKAFFVTPSDSLALLASFNHLFLKTPLKGVARSMPTSGAIDKVAQKLGIQVKQTPTGWKFFGNLMEEELIGLCGEQSFGTGSPHVREKDGLWTILAWLQILAKVNEGVPEGKLVSVESLLTDLWKTYGRNFYTRYDYESLPQEIGNKLWDHLESQIPKYQQGDVIGRVFNYTDEVDHSVSKNQGLIFSYADGSRVIFRKSGTGSAGITIRIYFQKYEQKNILEKKETMLEGLVKLGKEISQIQQITGRNAPTVIT